MEFPKFDVIVSNPPYLTREDLDRIEPELNFEPSIALNGGREGLDFFKRIIFAAKRILKRKGFIFFEVGMEQAKSVSKLLKENGFESLEISKDDSGIERIVSGVLI